MLYFAYGSNLHPARLAARAPSARLVSTGYCRGRRPAFHKVGQDGTGKCDAPVATEPDARVFGAVYELVGADLAALDGVEGLGAGYLRERLAVRTGGGVVEADAYLAQPGFVDPARAPFDWYLELVLAGARYHGFPAGYVAALAATPTVPDADRRRAADNLSVLAGPGR